MNTSLFKTFLATCANRASLAIFFSLILTFFSFPSFAAKILKVKGNKVLIQIEGFENIKKGDLFVANDELGNRKGLVKVLKLKRDKAFGIFKGTARP